MFDELFESISPRYNGFKHFANIVGDLENLLRDLDQEYFKEGDKNAAIDSIIQFLQTQKKSL